MDKKYFTEVEVELYSFQIKSNAIGRFIAGRTPIEISKDFNIPRRTIRNWIEKYHQGILRHAHHWIIPPPNGPFAEGKCRYCEKTSTMKNSLDDNGQWTMSNNNKKKALAKNRSLKTGNQPFVNPMDL